jgi:DoxX-like family
MKTKRIIYWITTGLLCLMMLIAATLEIVTFDESVKMLAALGYPAHIGYVLPVTKILGVAAILSKYSKTLKEWAYAGFFFDFVLAALAHSFSGVPSPIPAIVALVLLLTSYFLDREIYN